MVLSRNTKEKADRLKADISTKDKTITAQLEKGKSLFRKHETSLHKVQKKLQPGVSGVRKSENHVRQKRRLCQGGHRQQPAAKEPKKKAGFITNRLNF